MNKSLGHGYRVIGTMKDGSVNVFEYASEKVADSVVRTYKKSKEVASVVKEEF